MSALEQAGYAFAFHETAIQLACDVNAHSTRKFETAGNDIVRDALWTITHDALIMHRAVESLVREGWSSASAPVIRTILDLHISMLAILRGENRELNAFRYFYSGLRRLSRNQSISSDERRRTFKQIRDRIDNLPLNQREGAMCFLKEKDRPYWFSPEWSSPAEVLRQHAMPGADQAYAQYSAAAHGGFLGLRIHRDDPDRLDINPRLPPSGRALAQMVLSAKLIVDLVELRTTYERINFRDVAQGFRERVRAVLSKLDPDIGIQL